MTGISDNYRKLEAAEVGALSSETDAAWCNPEIPRRQYESVVQKELANYRAGFPCAPFDALVEVLNWIPETHTEDTRLLDVGASCGYYREVLQIKGFPFRYWAVDYSASFAALAQELYPGIPFRVGDARDLPFEDDSFDIVLHGACIMHIAEYSKCIEQAARVSRKYVIFHRTPVLADRPTEFHAKDAYGVHCLEIHFNEAELMKLFTDSGLNIRGKHDVFWNRNAGFGHTTYLLEKA